MRIGVLHPGEMGASIALALLDSGHDVGWVVEGRSVATQTRAQSLFALDDLSAMSDWALGIVSICPPDAALDQARLIVDAGFAGVYVDANAVAPATAQRMADLLGNQYVDGGVIGPPALKPGTTRLYLSGEEAGTVANWFTHGNLDAIDIGAATTGASALKMAYAAYTKGSSALLLAVNALASAAGVEEALSREWTLSQPNLAARSEHTAKGTSHKAWRFVGEMQEIEQTFEQYGLPGGFHRGAAEIYRRMAELKDQPPADLEEVLRHLLR